MEENSMDAYADYISRYDDEDEEELTEYVRDEYAEAKYAEMDEKQVDNYLWD